MAHSIISPGRVCLFGDHADCHGFPVIAASIDLDIELSWKSGSNLLNGKRHAFLDACVKAMDDKEIGQLDIRTSATLPAGHGLSSSAALCNGIIACFNVEYGLGLSISEIAGLSYIAESKIYGSRCGQMDMYSSALGGIHYIDCKTEPPKYERINLKSMPVLIADTGVTRHIAPILQEKRQEYLDADKDTVNAIYSINNIVQQAKIALQNNDHKLIGKLMNESQSCLEQYGVCHPKNSELLEIVRPYVEGAKITGGGMGGCIIAYGNDIASAKNALKKNGFQSWQANVSSGLRYQ
jgi:mevalonate kinase